MITALIPTYNCEHTIRDCLESVKWVDHIFVVDSFSNDQTLDICRNYTDWIVQHEYINSATQKNWAMSQIQTEWVLQIDSDEVVEPALVDEIKKVLNQSNILIDGYRIPRKNLLWGQWVRSCNTYPDWQLRLFKAQLGRWTNREVHAHVTGLNHIESLSNHLIHNDLTDLSAELLQFARQVVVWESNELVKKDHHWRWIDVSIRPAAIFLLLYVGQGGYRDGFRGFYLSVYRAFYSFMIYTRLYELEIHQGLRR